MATFIAPLPSAFNHEAKDLASEFRYWRQCFNDFCAINKITDAQTLIKLFRSCVGRHIVTYLEDLPNYGQLTTVKQLLDTVENRYKKAVNVHAERLNFRSIGINPGESLLDYESRLNSFSKSCEFQNYDRDSAHLEMVLIAAPQKIKEKLLLTPDLTLDIAKNILKTMEVGTKWVSQASSIKLDNNNDVKIKQEVNLNLAKRDKQKGSNTSEAGGSRKRFACSRCGSNRHASNDKACPALGKKCNNCSLTGHFAQYCKTKASRIEAELAKSSKKATANKNPRQCNNIQANANDSNEENSDSAQIYSVATINKIDVKHKYMEVRLNGMPIKMLVDSGSNVTIVTAEVFNKIKFKGHKLALSAEKLMDCQSKEIPVLGEYSVEAQIGKDKFREKVLVTKLDKCLLGNSFITKMKNFDWNNFLTNSSELECNQINDTKAKLEELKNEFSDIFKENPQSKVRGKLAHLVLKKDAVPKFLPARTVPIAIEKQVDAEIEKMVKQGYWTPVSQSKWATPLVPVPKKDGGVRICGDYKPTVNTQIEIAHHPLPTVELITSKLSGNTVFSKIDLKTAFQQLELDEASKELCTVNTNKGLFKVNRLPFGVASSPALWQRTMDSILINLPGVCCFVDDILVAAKTETEHLNRLKAVFKRLQENDVLIKPEKCVFMTKEISYLGFKITDKGLFKTDEKIKAIKESLAPTNVSEVRSFLGLVTFYSKFVPNLATIAAPIYQLTRKNVPFDWNEECQKAFQSLKQELISNRFLTYFNPKLPLIVSCDASPVGLGAVLAHKLPSGEEKPIAYASRTLSNSERNYSQIDKESLAIIFAVKHFHFFLYGKDRFTIYTDHKPLISLFGEHAMRFVQTFKNFVKRADHDKNLNQRQIDEAILKFLMTYRCTPHSGTEMSPSYLMLNRQIKNVFDLLRTKTSKIEIKNLEHQDKNCKAVSEYTEGESILFRNYNSQNKWEKGIIQKKIGSLHYLIKYNNKVVKKHLDQLRPNYIKSNSTHDPSNIASEIPCDNESLRKLINHPVSQDTARNPVMLRRSARINKGKPPRRLYYDYSDSE